MSIVYVICDIRWLKLVLKYSREHNNFCRIYYIYYSVQNHQYYSAAHETKTNQPYTRNRQEWNRKTYVSYMPNSVCRTDKTQR